MCGLCVSCPNWFCSDGIVAGTFVGDLVAASRGLRGKGRRGLLLLTVPLGQSMRPHPGTGIVMQQIKQKILLLMQLPASASWEVAGDGPKDMGYLDRGFNVT